MIQTTSIPSASVLAKKAVLLSQADAWVTIRDPKTGQRVIVMPNETGSRVYYVHPAGKACNCKAGQFGTLCAHRLAVIERANHEALEAWLSEPVGATTVAKAFKIYEELMPAECDVKSCTSDAEPKQPGDEGRYCTRHQLVSAF